MNLKLKRTPGIYLVGFMGCGKTTIGRMLAEHIGWRFTDLDEDIEAQQKKAVTEIFETLGEEEFRRIEHQALERRVRRIRRGTPTVLSLGGGAFTRQDNVDLIADHGISIWIDVPFAVVRNRVSGCVFRPLARDPQKLEALYYERRRFYEKADYHIQVTEDNSRKAFEQLLKLRLLD
jgi:shikimate kinase